MSVQQNQFEIVAPFKPLFYRDNEHYKKRFLVFHGGRGSAKSIHGDMACLVRGIEKKEKILCARQFQNSIKDSTLSSLADLIDKHNLDKFYEVQRDTIIGKNGTEFIFKGLHNNTQSIKSISGVTLCRIEEAQSLSEKSYEVLIPTIRAPGSQFIITYNVDTEEDPTYKRFNVNPPPNAYVRKVNYDENPFFPDVLREEMEWCRATDLDAFHHVWGGDPRTHSEAQIFHGKWEISRFEPPEGVEFIHGLDFGFANDPNAATRSYIHDGCLFIYQESYHLKLDIDFMADTLKRDIPGIEKYVVRADNARPETISYLQRHGLPNVIGVKKWTGNREDAITHCRSYKKIIIHEQCKHAIQEAKLYSWKIHKQTGDIMPEAEDKNDHVWDSIFYGLEPVIVRSGAGVGFLEHMGAQVAVDRAEKEKANAPIPAEVSSSAAAITNKDSISFDYSKLLERDRANLD